MDDPDSPGDPWLHWLEGRLSRELGTFSRRPAPRWGVRVYRRRGLGLGRLLTTGAAILALGGGAVMAADLTSTWSGGPGFNPALAPTAGTCSASSHAGQEACAPGHGGSVGGGANPRTAGLSASGSSSTLPLGSGAGTGSSAPPSGGASAHGQSVSGAAHTCPKGQGGVHGRCVSSVAHGSPTPSVTGSPKGKGKGKSAATPGAHGRGN
jgi:hypothetical protein